MKISKLPSLLCVVTTGAMCLTVRADDNPAQAAARIALAKALFDLSSQSGTNAASMTEPAQAAPGMVISNVSADTNAMTEPVASTETTSKKKKKADAAMAAESQPSATTAADQKAAAEMAALAAATNSVAPAGSSATMANAPKPTSPAVSMTDTNFAGSDLGMKPIAAPALPISGSKQDQLQALLKKYQADQITPEEYHKQREAILSQP